MGLFSGWSNSVSEAWSSTKEAASRLWEDIKYRYRLWQFHRRTGLGDFARKYEKHTRQDGFFDETTQAIGQTTPQARTDAHRIYDLLLNEMLQPEPNKAQLITALHKYRVFIIAAIRALSATTLCQASMGPPIVKNYHPMINDLHDHFYTLVNMAAQKEDGDFKRVESFIGCYDRIVRELEDWYPAQLGTLHIDKDILHNPKPGAYVVCDALWAAAKQGYANIVALLLSAKVFLYRVELNKKNEPRTVSFIHEPSGRPKIQRFTSTVNPFLVQSHCFFADRVQKRRGQHIMNGREIAGGIPKMDYHHEEGPYNLRAYYHAELKAMAEMGALNPQSMLLNLNAIEDSADKDKAKAFYQKALVYHVLTTHKKAFDFVAGEKPLTLKSDITGLNQLYIGFYDLLHDKHAMRIVKGDLLGKVNDLNNAIQAYEQQPSTENFKVIDAAFGGLMHELGFTAYDSTDFSARFSRMIGW